MSATAPAIKFDADVEAARAGEQMSGFEDLYRAHYRRVYSICLRMLGNESEAEDLVQEIFIQLSRKLSSFRGDAAFTTWLHRLSVNQVLMHFRKPGVKRERMTDDGTLPEGEGSPWSSMVDRLSLEKAIGQLPPGYRTVFTLHDVEGYEHDEIAELLGCSPGTSKSQLFKARRSLRGKLAGYL